MFSSGSIFVIDALTTATSKDEFKFYSGKALGCHRKMQFCQCIFAYSLFNNICRTAQP